MKKSYKIGSIAIAVVAGMAIVGAFFPSIIEFSLELFYNSEVKHLSTPYSYKPGQIGTDITFWRQQADVNLGYQQINTGLAVFISFLFYFGIILLLYTIFLVYKNYFSSKEIEKKSFYGVIINTIVCVVISTFFIAGNQNLYGLNEENVISAFNPTGVEYIPNGKGTGNIWLLQKERKRIALLENNKLIDEFTSDVIIGKKEYNKEGVVVVDTIHLINELGRYHFFSTKKKMWIIDLPNTFYAWDLKTLDNVCQSSDHFFSQFSELNTGIYSLSWFRNTDSNILKLTLNNGEQYYYHVLTEILSKKPQETKEKKHYSYSSHFYFEKFNGQQTRLKYYNAVNGKKITLGSDSFLSPLIVYRNNQYCVFTHLSNLSDNTSESIDCFDSSGKPLWSATITQLLDKINKRNEEISEISYSHLDGEVLVLLIKKNYIEPQGAIGVNIKSGKIEWQYCYEDLRLTFIS